jgi:ribosomal-protein-alanine N-acetyltransferase
MLNLNFTPFPVIDTERLVLREIMDDDLPEIYYQRSDPEMMKYVDRTPARSLGDAGEFIGRINAALQTNEGITWGITLKNEPKLIGNIGIWRIEKEHHRAEIGYVLHTEHQSKGYASEALKAIINYGFSVMKLHSLEANVNPLNTASIKLLERNNFVKEAHFKENYYFDGKYLDSAIYSLLSSLK